MKKMVVFTLFSLLLIGMATGCGPKTVRVSGRITFDGEPGKDISVLFQSASTGNTVPEPAVGLTNEKGEFSLALTDSRKRGAIPGDYVVYIAWVNPNQGDVVEGSTQNTPIPYKIPTRAKNGQLTFTVPPEGTTEANFEFDSKKESYAPSGV
ncbi:MAG: hypothetical protein LBQ54_16560 [Planctomycetaceae bacterium]|nr:hypothetical protein [Planctomycetaceae bacterium]